MFLESKIHEDCCGCGACVDICPEKAIKMTEDDESFLYPQIDSKKCISCHLCEKACPIGYKKWISKENIVSYLGVASEEVIFESSSGGAFTAIYKTFLECGYLIYGVKFNDRLQVLHDCADTIEGCKEFRKSKYVQSNTNHCYVKIAEQLQNGKKILFTGTPCQCAALTTFLDAKKILTKRNLLTVSLLCHGVPSQTIFDSYIKELTEKNGDILNFMFRYKSLKHGKPNSRSARICFSSGKIKMVNASTDAFLKGYYTRLFYRPSCEKCMFARPERVSDITIADAWGIERLYPMFNPLKGASLILFNTDKGKESISSIKERIYIKELDLEWVLDSQEIFSRPTLMHKNRDLFFYLWKTNGFHYAVKKATYRPIFGRILGRIKRLFY